MTSHPAKYSDQTLAAIRLALLPYRGKTRTLYDPFAGTGKIHALRPQWTTVGTEIEEEWAHMSQYTLCMDAEEFMADELDESWDAVVTSPTFGNRMCLAPDHRILTDNLRWTQAGDLGEGDGLIAFDENTGDSGLKANGHAFRRKWRNAKVLQSYGAKAECVRVWLTTGESVVCTTDHPWLVHRARRAAQWVQAQDLLRFGNRPSHVLKQLDPWVQDQTYEAGWLAGIFDGEGSLSFGDHGSPKLMACQVKGKVADLITERLDQVGIKWSSIDRKNDHGQPMVNIYVMGGFPGILSALGRLRPERLISKLDHLSLASRTIQPWKVEVEAIEPLGLQDIQVIESSSRTYIGEGYLMHNSDHHNAKDDSRRITYRHTLGRPLDPNNSGNLNWGNSYRDFHQKIWAECVRVLRPGGFFVLHISDHIRKGEVQPVSKWHHDVLVGLGLKPVQVFQLASRRMKFGANRDLRAVNEYVYQFVKVAP